jgi:hypothetical protein
LIVNRYVEFHFNAYHNYWETECTCFVNNIYLQNTQIIVILMWFVFFWEYYVTNIKYLFTNCIFWRDSKSKRGNNSNKMLDGVVFSCQQIGVNTFYKRIESTYLFTIKWGTHYNKADDPVICISRVICSLISDTNWVAVYFLSRNRINIITIW